MTDRRVLYAIGASSLLLLTVALAVAYRAAVNLVDALRGVL